MDGSGRSEVTSCCFEDSCCITEMVRSMNPRGAETSEAARERANHVSEDLPRAWARCQGFLDPHEFRIELFSLEYL